jgi:hypothetical protein
MKCFLSYCLAIFKPKPPVVFNNTLYMNNNTLYMNNNTLYMNNNTLYTNNTLQLHNTTGKRKHSTYHFSLHIAQLYKRIDLFHTFRAASL